jgi:hypothetical protein
MDNLEFAKAMIRYEELYKELEGLRALIEDHVLSIGETQSIGNVYAKYSNGRTTYDYEAVKGIAPKEIVALNTEVVEKTDWRSICKALDFEAPIKKQPTPSVKVEVKLE